MTSAVILGATGQTGRYLLSFLTTSPSISSITEVGRRSAKDAGALAEGASVEKIKKLVSPDLAKPDEAESKKPELQGNDVVYITLGTTRKNAGSAEAFEAIDRGYPVLLAKLARTEGKSQKVVYLSSAGASASSPFLYPKSKGLTERELASLGYDETIIFRPGGLAGVDRSESRPAESIFLKVTGFAAHFSDSVQIPVQELGPAIGKAGLLGYAGLEKAKLGKKQDLGQGKTAWILSNADALKLAKLES